MPSEKPILYVLDPSFEDPAYPGEKFFCRHSSLVEGVLSHFPKVRDELEIKRLKFPRPRAEVIAAIGETNQGLPVLVLPPGETWNGANGAGNGRIFAAGAESILATLAERFGLPVVHP